MPRLVRAAARFGWVAALVSCSVALTACGGDTDTRDADRPAVSFESVAALQGEGAARFLYTDAALADLETVVAALDSAGQAQARPLLDDLRSSRASLQRQLDSLNATRFPDGIAFDTTAASIRDRLDALDAAIARDRVLVIPEAGDLRFFAAARLGPLGNRIASLRADSTAESLRQAAELDSARVRVEQQVALLSRRGVPFDSLRTVLSRSFGDLQRFRRDTLAMRFRPDSLR
ncbi:MAG: hypothetical protein AAF791_15775 [Bacteroidota bacterium]